MMKLIQSFFFYLTFAPCRASARLRFCPCWMVSHFAGNERKKAFPWITSPGGAALSVTVKIADFCRATGLHHNTPQRWKREGVEIPGWVPKHPGLVLELQHLHAAYLMPPKGDL